MIINSVIYSLVIVIGISIIPSRADAHGIGGVSPSPTQSIIKSIAPETNEFTITSIENGERVHIRRTGHSIITVLGVDLEKYIQLRPSGVYVNQKSSTRVINLSTSNKMTTLQLNKEFLHTSSDPDEKPLWKKISSSDSYTWHDHRTHYMGKVPNNVKNLGTSAIVIRVDGSQSPAVDHTVNIEFVAHPSTDRYIYIYALGILIFLIVLLAFIYPQFFISIERKPVLILLLGIIGSLEAIHLISYLRFVEQSLVAELTSIMYGLISLLCTLICLIVVTSSQERPTKTLLSKHAPLIALTGLLSLIIGTIIEYKALIEPYPASTLSLLATRILVMTIGCLSLIVGIVGIRHIKEDPYNVKPDEVLQDSSS